MWPRRWVLVICSSMTAALEGGEWSAGRPGRTLPPGKTRYPFYRRLSTYSTNVLCESLISYINIETFVYVGSTKKILLRIHQFPFLRWNIIMKITHFVTFSVDKKTQLDVTFCILYFSSNSCSTCFGQPCAHHQELTTA